ncbi:uncharacterized protein LOC125045335 [Penaeus chinensis]|uniref:uncharacterized protein LOC125045335 n=1 Tax=Penaeus chinensis TaxID=139456 RepID=UPI001FB68B48|nr:uncharacterized protein LOC125045335 [Penaeus chinensis]
MNTSPRTWAAIWACWCLWAWVDQCSGAVIPPRWVNHTLNPCAAKSWQLLYWPEDGSCHRIFTQGPCGDSQEFYYDPVAGSGACRCPRAKILYPPTGLCYAEYTKGPCTSRQYLVTEEDGQTGTCRAFKECPPRHVFWPQDDTCYQYHTRGPCLKGYLIYINPITGFPECGCDRNVMFSNYWSLTGLCFELFERGPCLDGAIFLYNATRGSTECSCSASILTNYHRESDGCFELNQRGPCQPGQVFTFDPREMTTQCRCREDHALWAPSGHCHRLYSRGPCDKGHFFISAPGTENGTALEGECHEYPCSGTRRYHPATETCYRLGWRGPCPEGQLFIYDEETPLRGACGCTRELVGYWPEDDRCYELGGRGPCQHSQVLSYDKATGGVQCTCDIRKGFVQWHDDRCYRIETRGPCAVGEIMVIKRWRPVTPTCTPAGSSHTPNAPLLLLTAAPARDKAPQHHRESNSVTAARGDSSFTLGANDTLVPAAANITSETPLTPAQQRPPALRNGRRLSSRPAPTNIYSLVAVEDATGGGAAWAGEGVAVTAFPQGRTGRSMADTETWGFLDGSYFKIPGTSPGTYYTGRPDGEPSLQPWWGEPST